MAIFSAVLFREDTSKFEIIQLTLLLIARIKGTEKQLKNFGYSFCYLCMLLPPCPALVKMKFSRDSVEFAGSPTISSAQI